jgi:hypothetical protein
VVWHVNYNKNITRELAKLCDILRTSRTYGLTNLLELARTHEKNFNIPSKFWRIIGIPSAIISASRKKETSRFL